MLRSLSRSLLPPVRGEVELLASWCGAISCSIVRSREHVEFSLGAFLLRNRHLGADFAWVSVGQLDFFIFQFTNPLGSERNWSWLTNCFSHVGMPVHPWPFLTTSLAPDSSESVLIFLVLSRPLVHQRMIPFVVKAPGESFFDSANGHTCKVYYCLLYGGFVNWGYPKMYSL
jgi:hypothetical protein